MCAVWGGSQVPRYPQVLLETAGHAKARNMSDALKIAVAAEIKGLIRWVLLISVDPRALQSTVRILRSHELLLPPAPSQSRLLVWCVCVRPATRGLRFV